MRRLRGVCLLALCFVGCSRPPEHPNLLLVTIDTLRADHVGCYGDTHATTPVIDRLCTEGMKFDPAYTPVPLTLAAHATILTGEEPPEHGVRSNGVYVLGGEQHTLAEVLRDGGYDTGAFVGAFPLDRRFGLAQGFQVYDDGGMSGTSNFHYAERRAAAVAERATSWMAARGDHPFFAWVHLYDPHDPYDPPEPWKSRFALDPYRGEIAYVDSQVGLLFDALRNRGSWDRTVIIVTADHGESLGEHGEDTHGFFVYDATLRVPLIVKPSKGTKAPRRSGIARLADIAPTALELLHLRPGSAMSGRSLVRTAGITSAYAESLLPQLDYNWAPLVSRREGRWKYIAAPEPELYDTAADPEETKNVIAAERAVAARMQQLLAADRTGFTRSAPPARVPDSDAANRLASLGYASGTAGPEASSGLDPKRMLPLAREIDAISSGPLGSRETISRLQALEARDPGNNLIHRRLAAAFSAAGQPALAAQEYELAMRAGYRGTDIRAGAARAWASAAAAADMRGARQRAAEAMHRARALAADDPDVIEAHAIWLGRHGDLGGAERELVRLTESSAARWTAWYQLGMVRIQAGRYGEAATALERARVLARNPDVLFALGQAYRELGDPRAGAVLAEFLAIADPRDPRRALAR